MVIVLLLLGLITLESVDQGALGSRNVWIRQWITIVLMSLAVLQQIRQHLPEFELNLGDCLLITVISSVCDVAFALVGATLIGYPMPFAMLLGKFPWYVSFTAIFIARTYAILRDVSHSLSRMGRYILVSFCLLTLTVIYPLYGYTYKNLSATKQMGFVLVPPVIKIVTKNWICRALPDIDDAKPEAVIFNVEIFHSLFVSLCMGNTASSRTLIVLMGVDVFEAWVAFHDVLDVSQSLKPVARKLKTIEGPYTRRLPSVSLLANVVAESESAAGNRVARSRCSGCTSQQGSLVVDAAHILRSDALLRSARILPESAAVQSVPSLEDHVHARLKTALTREEYEEDALVVEFIVLIEYTDVIIPTVYNVLVLVFFGLPNREFYSFSDGICTWSALYKIVANVQLYASLELVSLVVMAFLMQRRFGLSVFHQLAFVLEDRAANIQAKLLLWVLHITQNSLVQLGADYTFHFGWLRRDPTVQSFAFKRPCPNGTLVT